MQKDIFGLEQPVSVIDRMRVKPGAEQQVLDLFSTEYAVLAAGRMRQVDLTITPPFPGASEPRDVVIHWEYPSLTALWTARMAEEGDARLSEFWQTIDQLVETRSRQLGRNRCMEQCGPLDDNPPPIAMPAGTSRVIGFGKIAPDVLDQAIAQSSRRVRGGIEFGGKPGDAVTVELQLRVGEEPADLFPQMALLDDAVTLGERIDSGCRAPGISRGVKRTVLLRSIDGLPAANIEAMERQLAQFGRHVGVILNWSLSRVKKTQGPVKWTHCFEQEFADVGDITGDYLNHPFHWAVADRFFHREAPERSADAFFQSIYQIDQSALC